MVRRMDGVIKLAWKNMWVGDEWIIMYFEMNLFSITVGEKACS